MSKNATMANLKKTEEVVLSVEQQKKANEALVAAMNAANEDALKQKAINTELLKIKVNPDDVKFLLTQLEIEAPAAERMLRVHNNDVKAAIAAFITPKA